MSDMILWMIYAGALVAKKQVRYQAVTEKLTWQRNLDKVREHLAAQGLTL